MSEFEPIYRALREHSREEPSPEIARAIRAAARRAVNARPGGITRSWFQPMAAAAVLVLGVTTVLVMQKAPPTSPPAMSTAPAAEPTAGPPPADMAEKASAQNEARERKEEPIEYAERVPIMQPKPQAVAPAPAAAASAAPVSAAPVSAPPVYAPPAAPPPPPPPGADQLLQRTQDAAAKRDQPMLPSEQSSRTGASSAAAAETPTPRAVEAAPMAASRAAAPAPERQLESAESWLDRLRALKQSTDSTRYEAELKAFKQAHPNHPLPTDW